MTIEIGSIVTNVGFIQGRNNSNHGVVISLMADGKIARVTTYYNLADWIAQVS